jgi:hypothetical protein
MNKIIKSVNSPLVKTVLVVLGVLIALPYVRALVANVPVLNKL